MLLSVEGTLSRAINDKVLFVHYINKWSNLLLLKKEGKSDSGILSVFTRSLQALIGQMRITQKACGAPSKSEDFSGFLSEQSGAVLYIGFD